MDHPVIKIKREPHGAGIELPAYQTEGAAGMDIRSAEELVLQPGETRLVATGLAMEIEPGFEVQVRPRSGLAAKHGITLLNSPGTIDCDFRGEVKVIMTNLGSAPFAIARGDRIAQLVVARVERASLMEVVVLGETPRGSGGFGHTGRQ